jgi:hypothetical protein
MDNNVYLSRVTVGIRSKGALKKHISIDDRCCRRRVGGGWSLHKHNHNLCIPRSNSFSS